MAPSKAALHQDRVTPPPESQAQAPAPQLHPLLKKPVPHAYALIPAEGRPGLFYAVHLTGVQAEQLEHLEPNSRCLSAPFGLIRIPAAMEKRHAEKKWGV